MIVFYTIIFIIMWKYRYVPLDMYDEWKTEREEVEDSLKDFAGLDYKPPKQTYLRRVK